MVGVGGSSIHRVWSYRRKYHQENMSIKRIPPYDSLLYSKTRVCRGIPIFLF